MGDSIELYDERGNPHQVKLSDLEIHHHVTSYPVHLRHGGSTQTVASVRVLRGTIRYQAPIKVKQNEPSDKTEQNRQPQRALIQEDSHNLRQGASRAGSDDATADRGS